MQVRDSLICSGVQTYTHQTRHNSRNLTCTNFRSYKSKPRIVVEQLWFSLGSSACFVGLRFSSIPFAYSSFPLLVVYLDCLCFLVPLARPFHVASFGFRSLHFFCLRFPSHLLTLLLFAFLRSPELRLCREVLHCCCSLWLSAAHHYLTLLILATEDLHLFWSQGLHFDTFIQFVLSFSSLIINSHRPKTLQVFVTHQ